LQVVRSDRLARALVPVPVSVLALVSLARATEQQGQEPELVLRVPVSELDQSLRTPWSMGLF
jgi:hypothetical protein